MKKRMTEKIFLDDRLGRSVAVYLVNGIKLVGTLVDHDYDVVFLLPDEGRTAELQMIQKNAVSTIQVAPRTTANSDLGALLRFRAEST